MNPNSHEFETLVWKYLDKEMSAEEFSNFESLLTQDRELRKHYQRLVEIHQRIHVKATSEPEPILFPAPQESPSSSRSLSKWAAVAGIAACVAFLLVFTVSSTRSRDTNNVRYLALRDAVIRGSEIVPGDMASSRMVHLINGAVALEFPGKTKAVIEGPAFYQVLNDQSVMLSAGTVTVHHEGKPGNFKVVTPVGKIVDWGTKFGVSVGNGVTDSLVMTEVYEGEITYKHNQSEDLTITKGESLAIVGDHKQQIISKQLDGRSVSVRGTFELSSDNSGLKSKTNLALGKPVTSPSHYNRPKSGETFPPSALTDNRLNDTGAPWDWSFWLAEDRHSGEATIDLLDTYTISRVELQNTKNRHHVDRGMKTFVLEVSTDNAHFEEVLKGELAWIDPEVTGSFPIESFEFDAVQARYVRIRGVSHYSRGDRNHGGCGGLNEVRVFE